MKIAAGLIDDFEGQIAVGGNPVHLNSPRAATRAGIAMIHQELNLVPELAVDENIFSARRNGVVCFWWIAGDRSRRRARYCAVRFPGADRSARKPATGR